MDQETKVLLYCLSLNTNGINAAGLEQFSPFDWDSVIQKSLRHRVAPLLYQRLKTLNSGLNVPANIIHRLQKIYLNNAVRNLRLYHELGHVLGTLRDANIPVIVLKGAHLAEVVYGDIALRPMVDVDLMARKDDLDRVNKILLGMNYRPLNNFTVEDVCKMHKHLPRFIKPDSLSIEVHWTISNPSYPFKVDITGLWKRAQPAAISGVNVMVLSPEDLFLHLCLHASFQHMFSRLRHLFDICKTIQYFRNEIDWEQIQHRARQWGLDKCVHVTLFLAKDLLDANIPNGLFSTLKPVDFDLHLATEFRERIFEAESSLPSIPAYLSLLYSPKQLLDKLGLLLKRIFRSTEEMARIYPVSQHSLLTYLFYPVRIFQLSFKHSRIAWRLLGRYEEMVTSAEQENKKIALREWLASS